jgi:hypothetical protein
MLCHLVLTDVSEELNCLLLMEAVSNNIQLNQLLSSIKSSWPNIAIPRNHYDGGVLNPKTSYLGMSLIKDK